MRYCDARLFRDGFAAIEKLKKIAAKLKSGMMGKSGIVAGGAVLGLIAAIAGVLQRRSVKSGTQVIPADASNVVDDIQIIKGAYNTAESALSNVVFNLKQRGTRGMTQDLIDLRKLKIDVTKIVKDVEKDLAYSSNGLSSGSNFTANRLQSGSGYGVNQLIARNDSSFRLAICSKKLSNRLLDSGKRNLSKV